MNRAIKATLVRTAKLSIAPDQIPDDASLTDTLNVSSLQFIEFVVALEKEFGFVLAEDDSLLDCIDTVAGISAWLASKGHVSAFERADV